MPCFTVTKLKIIEAKTDEFVFSFEAANKVMVRLTFPRKQLDTLVAEAIVALRSTAPGQEVPTFFK